MHRLQKTVLILLITFLNFQGFSQNFQHLTSKDGLPDNNTRFVYQDDNGYIYAGTRNGVCRYDGYKFSTAEYKSETGIAPREFSAMIECVYGYFTVAANGIYEYNCFNNSLTLSRKLNLLDEACFAVYGDRVFCGNSEGLFMYNPVEKQWIESNKYVSDIANIHVRSMLVTKNNELLIGTNNGYFRYDKEMNLLSSIIGQDRDYNNINGIEQDTSGCFWISTFTNVYKLDQQFRIKDNYRNYFADKHIRCIEYGPGNKLWIGGESGIVILDPGTGQLHPIYRETGKEQNLNDNAVYSIFRDRADNMWVGTYFGGINLWNKDLDKFSITHTGEGSKYMSGKVVREMQEDARGNLWLALEDGGLNYLNTSSGNISRYFFEGENEYKNVHSIILEGDQIWIGSFNKGLECYGIRFTDDRPVLHLIASYIPDIMVFDIDKDDEGNIYAGSVGQVFVLERNSGKIRSIHGDKLENLIFYTLKTLPGKRLLLGTLRNGLYLFNTENRISTSFSKEKKFSGMQTISFISKPDSSGYLIAASDGLYCFHDTTDVLSIILKNEEANSEFRSVIPDREKGYWISTTNGLLYSVPSETFLHKFNRYDGLPENQFNFNSAFRSEEGRLYFGTYNGLVSFIPEELKEMKAGNPKINFTSYTVVGKDRSNLNLYFLDNSIQEIRLKPYQTYLSIEFSTLGYSRTKNVEYQFRLRGKNTEWDHLGSNRSLSLTKLSKGWHEIQARAVVDGIASPYINSLSIYREPTILETVYAYILYCLIILYVLYLIRRDYLKRLKQKNALLMERFEKEHQQKLNEQKMQFFLNISHEFRTPLTIIGGTISNIVQKFSVDDELGKKLKTIQSTSDDLNQLVDNFIRYGKLDAGLKPLEMKKGQVMAFIRNACDMFDNWAEINRITFTKNITDNKEIIYYDSFKLERVLYNLLSNAFKFNTGNGEVYFEAAILHEYNKLNIIVSDSGPGIDEDTLEKIRKKFRFTENITNSEHGIGLSYTAGLVHQMKGTISVETQHGQGSVFKVELPVVITGNEASGIPPPESSPENTIIQADIIKESRNPHILIIDDNEELLAMLSEALGRDFHVTVESSARKALSKVKEFDFELIICDIMMPEIDGLEVIDRIHSDILTSHIPILILTAAANKEIELKSYKKGAVSFLAKPFKTEELKIKIGSILEFRKELIRRYSTTEDIVAEEITYSERDEQFITKACEIVNANIQNFDFNVDQFCLEMHASRSLLHTKLKHLTGLSATEFIRNIRLKQAYIYLKKGDFSVSEVAFKCGFNDPNYFSKCFKKKYEVFPSAMKR